MPFFATMPITMMSPMKLATLNVVPVSSSAPTTPPKWKARMKMRMAVGAAKLRNSVSRTPKTNMSASSKYASKLCE